MYSSAKQFGVDGLYYFVTYNGHEGTEPYETSH